MTPRTSGQRASTATKPAKTKAGNASRGGRRGRGETNRQAAEATISALRELGRLEPVDSANVAAIRAMAAALDENPDNAALWREYHAFLNGLKGHGDHDGEAADILEQMRATIRDPEAA